MSDPKANTEPVAQAEHGDHDRVAMLSLKADGSVDQTNPEIIGNREFAEAATREQFRQQAVSAVDQAERSAVADPTVVEDAPQDPFIQDLTDKHEAAAEAAVSAADATVAELFTKDEARTSTVPGSEQASTDTTSTSTAKKSTTSSNSTTK